MDRINSWSADGQYRRLERQHESSSSPKSSSSRPHQLDESFRGKKHDDRLLLSRQAAKGTDVFPFGRAATALPSKLGSTAAPTSSRSTSRQNARSPADSSSGQRSARTPPSTVSKSSSFSHQSSPWVGKETALSLSGVNVLRKPSLRPSPGDAESSIARTATSAKLAIPASPQAAPRKINLRKLHPDFQQLWERSHPYGVAQEHGGIIAARANGKLELTNRTSGEPGSGMVQLNYDIPSDLSVRGGFHTHPYTSGNTGVSISGGDVFQFISIGDRFTVVQSGDWQFMYLRTHKTPSRVEATLHESANAQLHQLEQQGIDFAEGSRQVSCSMARHYNLAYYEGSNGMLRRVYPPSGTNKYVPEVGNGRTRFQNEGGGGMHPFGGVWDPQNPYYRDIWGAANGIFGRVIDGIRSWVYPDDETGRGQPWATGQYIGQHRPPFGHHPHTQDRT